MQASAANISLETPLNASFKQYIGHGHFNDRGFLEGTGLHIDEAEYILNLVRPSLDTHTAERDFLLVFNLLKEYRYEQISALQFDILSTSTYELAFWASLESMAKALPPV